MKSKLMNLLSGKKQGADEGGPETEAADDTENPPAEDQDTTTTEGSDDDAGQGEGGAEAEPKPKDAPTDEGGDEDEEEEEMDAAASAVSAERTRIFGILESKEGQANAPVALKLAKDPAISVETAKAVLSATGPAAKGNAFVDAMRKEGGAKVGDAGPDKGPKSPGANMAQLMQASGSRYLKTVGK